ncbi:MULTISPECIES: plasmid replication protein RepC [unclassified Ensifer]|uniref:plasmid replication protein RepC n=1 Tax=unclassified Ensifer TaxID=2633371 RepID=UPI0008138002|nr:MULTISPECIES: plasmid replication protein RepC [unclassified Ensifer]OCP08402.1 replication initiation protein RepC [Ensifer sp. LC11]OCP09021.1 replication initiation protein RepC [Ensifer sp. LC13]OCP09804.1 replication initiation protein RepC [Ensifer sp. LC14]OCP32289.1 replication initiation protein RepC [Ensifer sp. LC499]
MQGGNVTTPFGRRAMTLGMLASQYMSREIEPETSADKWKLFRALCEAKPKLGISERALSVMNALLSFYPETTLSEENGLIVFPSNTQLSLRAHGMAEATLRRHIAALVDAGLLARRDSANGKRFARKDGDGAIDEAFGFSLAPLLSRAREIEQVAAEVEAERLQLRRLRERLTICRRDVGKLIEVALDEGVKGNWEAIHDHYRSLVASIPRVATAGTIAPILDEMEMLREEIANLLELRVKSQNMSASPDQTERHKQNSNTNSLNELEPSSGEELGAKPSLSSEPQREPMKAFPLGMVLQACPTIADYGPGGAVGSWRDLMQAAVVARSTLGVSPSAYQDACETMGPENAAAVIACILERAGHINSAGGYLRDLTSRARRGEFSLGPVLMALLRARGGGSDRKAS